MRRTSDIVRSRLTSPRDGDPFSAPVTLASAFHAVGDPGRSSFTYGRYHNPSWTALEDALSKIESGAGPSAKVLVFSSGMAAIHAVFGTVLGPNTAVVLPTNGYYTVRRLLQQYFQPQGIQLRFFAPGASGVENLLQGATLLWLETPTNPELDILDIRELTSIAHCAGARVAVDNTTATPLGQDALALGADFSVVSGTKGLTGHSDLVMGHVAVHDDALFRQLQEWRATTGAILGPMEAWLALRSLPTLPLRLERSCSNALAVAAYLERREDVTRVRFPGLPSHPGHAIACAQMTYFGPVISFVLKDADTAERFLAASRLITEATSFGGITSSGERRARWGGDDVHPGLIRMSVGCEAIEDILEDLESALNTSVQEE